MESSLFDKFAPSSVDKDQFLKDLRQLLGLNDEERCQVLGALRSILVTRTNLQEEHAVKQLCEQVGKRTTVIVDVLRCLKFFVAATTNRLTRLDSPDVWAADLVALEQIDSSEEADVAELLRAVHTTAREVEPELKRADSSLGLFPALRSVQGTVELRAIREDSYDSTMNIDDYISGVPKLLDLIGVASVRLRLDVGEEVRYCCFQADKQDL